MTRFLTAAYSITPFPKLWADKLSELMSPYGVTDVVDLGSGSGGPIFRVVEELRARGFKANVTLTDLYPNVGGSLPYWPQPVDAAAVPDALSGIRTMFASFHHFRPQAAHEILRDAFQRRRPIAIFEATSRTPAAVASTLAIPILVLVLTPRIRPLSWTQLLFTYLLPILPVLIFWDGLISQLRTYSAPELEELTRDLQAPEYRWQAGLIHAPGIPTGVPFLIGRPGSH